MKSTITVYPPICDEPEGVVRVPRYAVQSGALLASALDAVRGTAGWSDRSLFLFVELHDANGISGRLDALLYAGALLPAKANRTGVQYPSDNRSFAVFEADLPGMGRRYLVASY